MQCESIINYMLLQNQNQTRFKLIVVLIKFIRIILTKEISLKTKYNY